MHERQRTLKDKLIDAMLAVAASLEQLDQCCHESCPRSQPFDEALKNCLSTCVTSVQQLRAWEIEAMRLNTRTEGRLEDMCANHGFGIFHLIMSYWAVSLLLSARCWLVLGRIADATPASQVLASLLPNPQKYAMDIASNAHLYFSPTTGLVGPQFATFPLGAALHFIAATSRHRLAGGAQDNAGTGKDGDDEMANAMKRIRHLFQTDERARSTGAFLRSMAPDPAPQNLKGDTRNAEEHRKMAREWFKM